jgi:hypothetical protein
MRHQDEVREGGVSSTSSSISAGGGSGRGAGRGGNGQPGPAGPSEAKEANLIRLHSGESFTYMSLEKFSVTCRTLKSLNALPVAQTSSCGT